MELQEIIAFNELCLSSRPCVLCARRFQRCQRLTTLYAVFDHLIVLQEIVYFVSYARCEYFQRYGLKCEWPKINLQDLMYCLFM